MRSSIMGLAVAAAGVVLVVVGWGVGAGLGLQGCWGRGVKGGVRGCSGCDPHQGGPSSTGLMGVGVGFQGSSV